MVIATHDFTQAQAAKLAGWSLLILIITGLCGNFFVGAGVIDITDAEKTARNLVVSETRFRWSIVCILIMYNCDVIEAVALYVLLKPVHRSLALLSMVWRLCNVCIGGALLFAAYYEVQMAGASLSAGAINGDQWRALLSLFIRGDSDLSLIGLTFFSFGMALNGYLFLRSRFVPGWLSGFYLFSAVLLLTGSFMLLVYPGLHRFVSPAFILPDFLAELLLALWLIIMGAKFPAQAVE